MLARIFDLFTQVDASLKREHGGLGIGLTLVKQLVELHGGTVEARSAGVGRGSEFVVRLPVAGPGAPRPASPLASAAGPASPAPRRILVVDDNSDAAESLAILLRRRGHETAVALDGASALAVAGSFRPEVVLLDIGMPRMDGYEVARKLRLAADPEPPVLVAMTGYGGDDDRRRSAQAGIDHHLTKPVDAERLEQLLAGLGPPA
jgi:CheY-like chemotaxis protein